MKEKICYYCGTKYSAELTECPLCGQTKVEPDAPEIPEAPVEPVEERHSESKSRVAPKHRELTQEERAILDRKRDNRGNLIATIICIVLGLAVVAGVLFILSSLNIIKFGKEKNEDPSLALPIESSVSEVSAVPCEGISAGEDAIKLEQAGQTYTMTVKLLPENCTDTVSFESSNPEVFTVDGTGVIMAVGEGTAEVTAICGECADSVEVSCSFAASGSRDIPEVSEVTDPAQQTPAPETPKDTQPETASDISMSNEDFSLFSAGETATIKVKGSSEVAAWTTSDASVVTVENGKVTAIGPGNATITATIGNKSCTAIVRCKFKAAAKPAEESTEKPASSGGKVLSHEDVTLASGETFSLNLIEGGSRVSGVSWSTSDGSVCTVDANGNVTSVGSGMATITGTVGGEAYSCIVRCR